MDEEYRKAHKEQRRLEWKRDQTHDPKDEEALIAARNVQKRLVQKTLMESSGR